MILLTLIAASVPGSHLLVLVTAWAIEGEPLAVILNYGVLGIFFVLAITGQIYLKPHVNDLNKRIDAQAEIIREFQRATTTQTIPALGRATEVLEAQLHPHEGASVESLGALITRLEELAGEPRGGKR